MRSPHLCRTTHARLCLVGTTLALALVATATAVPGSSAAVSSGARSGTSASVTVAPKAASAGAGAMAGANAAERRGARKPNVVMVMADDMRADDLRFAPRLRKLVANHGLTMANSFSPYPLCCPARASFLTGSYTHNHGVYSTTPPYGYQSFDDSRTLATSMRRAGYQTGFIGKYLNGYGKMRSKVSGKRSATYVPRGWTDWRGAIENPGRRIDGKRVRGGAYHYFRTPFNVNGTIAQSRGERYQSNIVGSYSTAMARRFHRSRPPFFMYVNYVAPHHGRPVEKDDPSTIVTEDSVADGYSTPARPNWVKGRFDNRVTRAPGLPVDGGPAEADVSDKPVFFRTLPEVTPAERTALTLVTRQRAESIYVMDRQISRLIRTLKRTGEWRRTVFMFTSDNGYFLGEHRQRTGKVRAHEPSLRVPLLITGPGMRSGTTRYDPISTVDATATILDIAGARAPRKPDGVSRWKSLRAGDRGWSTPVVTEAAKGLRSKLRVPALPTNADGDPATPPTSAQRDPSTVPVVPRSTRPTRSERTGAAAAFGRREPRTSIGLRTARYSFSRYRNGEGELYDLVDDPAQLDNRYDDPDYAEVQRTLTTQWQRFKDCRGRACRASLPARTGLRASAARNRQITDSYWDTIRRIYGSSGVR